VHHYCAIIAAQAAQAVMRHAHYLYRNSGKCTLNRNFCQAVSLAKVHSVVRERSPPLESALLQNDNKDKPSQGLMLKNDGNDAIIPT
jgi:hypothetical protein